MAKRCSRCNTDKPSAEFHRQASARDGLCAWCKECKRAYKAAWDYGHQEHISAYSKEYAQRPDCKRRNREKMREKLRLDPEVREANRKRAAEWRKANPERWRAWFRERDRARRAATVGRIDYDAIRRRDNETCYLCGCVVNDGERHFDHVVPISAGGKHAMDNIRVTHAWCNRAKSKWLLSDLENNGVIPPILGTKADVKG